MTIDLPLYEVESSKLFSDSLIWQLNRDYYQNTGMAAWTSGVVPHQMTSNSQVGKTYAELILGFLQDLSVKGLSQERVYILELGAGHGRLGFHILKHLERLIAIQDQDLPLYTYVLSDIAEKSLEFFRDHPQLQSYYQSGILDYAYYDAVGGKEIHLQYSNQRIVAGELDQPILVIANYFFDSIPNDVFRVLNDELSVCSIALHSTEDPKATDDDIVIDNLQLTFAQADAPMGYYPSDSIDKILQDYRSQMTDTFLFFPETSLRCIQNLKDLSTGGMMLLSMDKGFHKVADIDQKPEPEIVAHGSFSLWVNYHAIGAYCNQSGGKAIFPTFSTFHLQLGCLIFMDQPESYRATAAAYQRFVDDFGPDDFNSIKELTYDNIAALTLVHLVALLRLSAYDSALFHKMLPRFQQVIKTITQVERGRLAETMHHVWNFYFNINESHDLALHMAAIFFDLGYYEDALTYFNHSTATYGPEADTYYNKMLCYYQLRQDKLFATAMVEAKALFPDSRVFDKLQELDMNAK